MDTPEAIIQVLHELAAGRMRAILIEVSDPAIDVERLVRAMHAASSRHTGPCIVVTPDNLRIDTIFRRDGDPSPNFLDPAHNGTLCVPEICDLPIEAQYVLLKYCDEYPYGIMAGQTIPTDTRLIAATRRSSDEFWKFITTKQFLPGLLYAYHRFIIPPDCTAQVQVFIDSALDSQPAQQHQTAPGNDAPPRQLDTLMAITDLMRLATSSERVLRIDAPDPRLNREFIARILHAASSRHNEPFIVYRTSAIPDVCADQKLFGRSGLCARAHQATLYIDDFCALPLSTQRRLLQITHEGEPDIRLIVSTRMQDSAIPGLRILQVLQGPYHDIPASITLPPLSEWPAEMRMLLGYRLPCCATSTPQPMEADH